MRVPHYSGHPSIVRVWSLFRPSIVRVLTSPPSECGQTHTNSRHAHLPLPHHSSIPLQSTRTGETYTMPCAAGELCLNPDHTPVDPDGHQCRGRCSFLLFSESNVWGVCSTKYMCGMWVNLLRVFAGFFFGSCVTPPSPTQTLLRCVETFCEREHSKSRVLAYVVFAFGVFPPLFFTFVGGYSRGVLSGFERCFSKVFLGCVCGRAPFSTCSAWLGNVILSIV